MDSTLARIQRWYAAQCDGDWEHGYGIHITTLDNPGWRVTIHLDGTELEEHAFAAIEHGFESDSTTDWHRIWVAENRFEGAGDATKLAFMLEQFLTRAELPGGDLRG